MILKKLDIYIIKKFLGSYLLTLLLFIIIAIVFDITEKLENFLDQKISLSTIIFTYYLNFIPYFAILFTPLFLFVAVIFFTSRMASRSEIIAILNSGITFNRMLFPYFIASAMVTALNIYANHWLVPDANKTRIAFENQYISKQANNSDRNIHEQVAKGEFIYMESFDFSDSSGYRFSFEKFDDGKLLYKLRADRIVWRNKSQEWELKNYAVRINDTMSEKLWFGKDTLIRYNIKPKDFQQNLKEITTLNAKELNDVIVDMKLKGADNVAFYEVEKYQRTSFPFAIFVLTLMGVSLASRKIRGGIGLHLGLGIALSFIYILFLQFSKTFSTNGNLPAIIGVWLPNIIFGAIALFLYRKAPK
ncbi:MAG: LptF/LptG family permease [Chitinophagales bacterium]|nr:LptF/LptG family permease [Chitinophagales bacterium]